MISTANQPTITLEQSKTMRRVGYALSTLSVLFLGMDIA